MTAFCHCCQSQMRSWRLKTESFKESSQRPGRVCGVWNRSSLHASPGFLGTDISSMRFLQRWYSSAPGCWGEKTSSRPLTWSSVFHVFMWGGEWRKQPTQTFKATQGEEPTRHSSEASLPHGGFRTLGVCIDSTPVSCKPQEQLTYTP